jgi:hypothetical protein
MIVKFLNKKSIDVTICNIFENRDAVVVQHTDTLQESCCYNVEAAAFKFGIKATSFHWYYSGLQDGLTEISETGVINFSQYIPTDRYCRADGNSSFLPDYESSTVSAAGAVYYGRTEGESKPTKYPNHGQETFDFSNGVKGYDVLNSVNGSEGNIDFVREMIKIEKWYKDNFGIKGSCGSDRQGRIGSKEIYMPNFLGIRKTSVLADMSYNNIERLDFIHRDLSSRWEDGFINGSVATSNTKLTDSINAAFLNNEFFNDFTHWHRAELYPLNGGIQNLYNLYELIYNSVNGRNAWYASYAQAVEYYWFKRMTKRVRATIVSNVLTLVADFDDEFILDQIAGIDKKLIYDRIKQPLSVLIDTTGTTLAGKNLQGAEMISLGSNQFVVDIPFIIEGNGLKFVVLKETQNPKYKDFTIPVITSNVNRVITTNVPTKAVIFSGEFLSNMSAGKRSNVYNYTHDFNGISGSRLGLISVYGKSSLTDI